MNNGTDIEIITSMDQSVYFEMEESEREVDRIIAQAIQEKDSELVLTTIVHLVAGFRKSGLCLAKLLYEAQKCWLVLDAGDNFYDMMFERTGISTTTIDRYISVWSMYAQKDIPEDFQQRIKLFPMKNQIPIAKAIEQGIDFTPEQWESLSMAPDNSSLLAEIRKAKGQEPRKNSLTITLKRGGSLEMYYQNTKYDLGWLNTEDTNEIVQKAISRILAGAGIRRE